MSLTVSGLSKTYHNKTANRNVSFEIGKGINGLLGANGAGKTTLMRMICGVVKPDSGSISLDGIEISNSEYLKGIGYLPQDFGYYPNFTAKEYLEYMAAIKSIDNPECQISDILKKVSLDDVATKKVKTFSGGMKQRLGIAQAILGSPKLLVLDEPTSGLDPKERIRFREILKSVSKDCIVLLSTHIVSDLESMADYIIMMQEGSVVYADTWDKSRNDLENVYMQKLMEVE